MNRFFVGLLNHVCKYLNNSLVIFGFSAISAFLYAFIFLPVFLPGLSSSPSHNYIKITPYIFVWNLAQFRLNQFLLRILNTKLDTIYPWSRSTLNRTLIQGFIATLICLAIPLIVMEVLIIVNVYTETDNRWLILNSLYLVSVNLIYVMSDMGLRLLRHWKLSLVELEKSKRETVQMQLELLKNQVNPHFLFNSLSTLSALVYKNADEAAEYIVQLCKVYRNMLEIHDREMISLKDELNLLDPYLYLIKTRYRDSLEFNMHISDEAKCGYLPSMTLQLLIENAIKHNIISTENKLKIEIDSNLPGRITVGNNLQLRKSPIQSTGTGLKNIQQRYSLVVGKKISVVEKDNQFIVSVPLLEADESSHH